MSKNGSAKIENIGQDSSSGQTVIYCRGQSPEIADAKFSMRIPDGPYAFYSVDIAKKLRGKTVLFSYLSTNDVRTPKSITFKGILE